METPNRNPWLPFVTGIKTAALIVIIGAVAVAADHVLFVAPAARAPATIAPPALVSSLPSDGVVFPDALRPTEADREPPPPSF